MTSSTPNSMAASQASYDPAAVERKWQERWRTERTNSPDLDSAEHPFYQLMMFPYPSAEGLHIGNVFAFTGNDIHGRFQRLQGHTVFEPIGFDAFGIHSENYALKIGVHPMELIPRNIENFRRQLRRVGLMVDWTHELSTTDPAYYKWTQWIFLKLLDRGLAYRGKAAVNWCPSCKTVLANEQVVNGACERCGTPVEQRYLEQWFFRISKYAPRLLANLDWIDWSEVTKTAQRNWIGKSVGAEIEFAVIKGGDSALGHRDSALGNRDSALGNRDSARAVVERAECLVPSPGASISVFTTRPDTIFGATYVVLAPEHPMVDVVTALSERGAVRTYVERAGKRDVVARKTGDREKTGVFTGGFVTNPATGAPVPVWVADYVLMEYGTGAIMAVPGHDERDFEFARAFGLPIVRVVAADGEGADTSLASAYTDNVAGRLVNSGQFDGLTVAEGMQRIVAWLAERAAAKATTTYRLHDWTISRQRYWGPPIPVIYCDECGMQAVPEKDLPVVLPYVADFRPDDTGISPLARHEEWYRVPCPECGKMARRETDVSDTFLDSAWYFLRYPSTEFEDRAFDAERTRRWLPVDSYIGGNEHAVLHLLYTRFVTMVLHDAGYLNFEEPFERFRAHGLIIRDGAKMSKTKGNVVNPDDYIERWGADTFRMYLMYLGPFDEGGDFRDAGISGVKRFLDRLWTSFHEMRSDGAPDDGVMRKLHRTIRKVTEDTGRLSYNTAIAAMMEYMNTLRSNERVPHHAEVEPLVQLVAPYAPHVAEELWERLGHGDTIFSSRWPSFDPSLTAEEEIEVAVQVNGKLRGAVRVARDVTQDHVLAAALAVPAIAKFASGPPKKVIFVPGRLLNIVW